MSDLPKQTITLQDGTRLQFLPAERSSWVGVFATGKGDANGRNGTDTVGLIQPTIARLLLAEFSDANRKVHSKSDDGSNTQDVSNPVG